MNEEWRKNDNNQDSCFSCTTTGGTEGNGSALGFDLGRPRATPAARVKVSEVILKVTGVNFKVTKVIFELTLFLAQKCFGNHLSNVTLEGGNHTLNKRCCSLERRTWWGRCLNPILSSGFFLARK